MEQSLQFSSGLCVCVPAVHVEILVARHREQVPRQHMCVRVLSRAADTRMQVVLLGVGLRMKPLALVREVLRVLI